MTSLTALEQNNSNQAISSFDNPQSLTLIPFLHKRVSDGPCSRVLYFLDGDALLALRLVSKMPPEEDQMIKDLIRYKIRFVVDGSEECNVGMITSYLNFRWQSLVFQETLSADDAYLALSIGAFTGY